MGFLYCRTDLKDTLAEDQNVWEMTLAASARESRNCRIRLGASGVRYDPS
jgi:hypothetical protein